ncbi:hypothetical protein L6452_02491 [Arctium lappa]|uniref:Uncharacterized protein n=1 Tax=Arctium lappa TaxID=4217 RepID=A0ACB9FJ85_ARCLA|nr:hypothetical protein L6452_02491 [Arctium lappa]
MDSMAICPFPSLLGLNFTPALSSSTTEDSSQDNMPWFCLLKHPPSGNIHSIFSLVKNVKGLNDLIDDADKSFSALRIVAIFYLLYAKGQ